MKLKTLSILSYYTQTLPPARRLAMDGNFEDVNQVCLVVLSLGVFADILR